MKFHVNADCIGCGLCVSTCKGVGTGFGGGNAGYAEPAGAAQSEGILTVFADIRQAVCAAPTKPMPPGKPLQKTQKAWIDCR